MSKVLTEAKNRYQKAMIIESVCLVVFGLLVALWQGKGAVEYWAAVVKPGRIMFEVGGVPLDVAKEALRLAAQKLPVKTKFVVARDYQN